MTEYTLDCTAISDKQALHSALAQGLCFPDWYGGNLDALYDCLTGITDETHITISDEQALAEKLGSYAASFTKVILRAAADNEKLSISFIQP
ncbi:MAG: barstar family protein [Oscillospiraceae bacterium]